MTALAKPAAIVNNDRKGPVEKKIVVSLKELGAKTNQLAVNRQP
jgi:hypothetical protein